jgi:hypothetical protein
MVDDFWTAFFLLGDVGEPMTLLRLEIFCLGVAFPLMLCD